MPGVMSLIDDYDIQWASFLFRRRQMQLLAEILLKWKFYFIWFY